jgi:5-methylcytosine-specific restriction enzyme A
MNGPGDNGCGDGFFFPPDGEALSREKQRARELRATAWWRRKKADGKCHYCGKKFRPDELTMDHVIPLARGGTSERHNLVPACKDCNNKKKHLLPVEWDEYLQSLKKGGP